MNNNENSNWIQDKAKALKQKHQEDLTNSESKALAQQIEKIKNADIAKDGLKISFEQGEEVNFNSLKKAIRDKLNSINLDGLFIQVSFLTAGNIVRTQTYSLMNEIGRKIIDRILRGGNFENCYSVDDFEIEANGMNKDFSQATVSTNQIVEITIFNQKNIGKEIKNKIYIDNGGTFYPYKINEKFLNNPELLKKLERYQIFTNLKNKAFNENCLVYAMRQTNLFSEDILINMRSSCYTNYIGKKGLQKFGEIYNIKFNVVKYFPDANKFEDITKGKNKFFGSVKDDALKIKLALVNGHYILNEGVEGVSTYYLKNYDDIEDKCKDKKPADKFKIVKKSNGKYKKDKSKYHEIKSYDFVKFMTSDNKPWSFDELNQLKINLYDFSDEDEYDLNNSSDEDFSDEDDYIDYLNTLDIKGLYKYITKTAAKDNYYKEKNLNKSLSPCSDLNDSSDSSEGF